MLEDLSNAYVKTHEVKLQILWNITVCVETCIGRLEEKPR